MSTEKRLRVPVLPPRRQQQSRPPIAPKPAGYTATGITVNHSALSRSPYASQPEEISYGPSSSSCSSSDSSSEVDSSSLNRPRVTLGTAMSVKKSPRVIRSPDNERHSSSAEEHEIMTLEKDDPLRSSRKGSIPIRLSDERENGQARDGSLMSASRSLTSLCSVPHGSRTVPSDPHSNLSPLSQRRSDPLSQNDQFLPSSTPSSARIPSDHLRNLHSGGSAASAFSPYKSTQPKPNPEELNSKSMETEAHSRSRLLPLDDSPPDDYYSESCSTGSNASSISSGTLSSKCSDDFSSASSSRYSAVDLAEASIDRYYRNGGGEFYDLDSVELGIQDCELESHLHEPSDLPNSLDDVHPSQSLAKHDMELMAENIITMISELKMSIASDQSVPIQRPRFTFNRSVSDSCADILRKSAQMNSSVEKSKNLPVIPETDLADHIYEEIRDEPSSNKPPRAPKPPPLPERNFQNLPTQQFAGGRFTRGRMSLPIRENPIAKKFLELGSASLSRKKLSKRMEVGKSVGNLDECLNRNFTFQDTGYSMAEDRQNRAQDSIILAFNNKEKVNDNGKCTFSFLRRKNRSVPNLVP